MGLIPERKNHANYFSLVPLNSGKENCQILQEALDRGGEILVNTPPTHEEGSAELDGTKLCQNETGTGAVRRTAPVF